MTKYDRMTKAELIRVILSLQKTAGAGEAAQAGTGEKDDELVHQVQVHQFELEAQNEELRNMRGLLEESRDRYADLYDFAPVGYLMLDVRGTIMDINLTGATLLGQERTRVLALPLSRYTADEDLPKLRQYLNDCWKTPNAVSTELRLNVKSRPDLIVQLISTTHHDLPTGRPTLRTTMLDITERKQAEEHVRELNGAAERRSQELEAANREVEMTQHELGALVYSVSHDLHVPIAQMEELADALIEDYGPELSETVTHIAQLVRENAREANRLAHALLVLSRAEQQPARKEMIAMRRLVDQAIHELEAQEPDRHMEIAVGELSGAEVDPALFQQVWTNLISNAWKFTARQDKPRIEIGMCQDDDVRVYFVKDNGAGFDMAEAGRLFRAFQRLHHAEEFPGAGLGLAISERIIRRHGGRVWADAKAGEGATFYFTIGG